jgi:hypothetical protein
VSEVRPPWDGDIPALERQHLRDARLYSDRLHMIDSLGPANADAVVELGVAVGQFSRAMIQRYDPSKFYAIDTFKLHEVETLWGRTPRDFFKNKTHLEYYLDGLAAYSDRVIALQGDGAEQLAQIEDNSIDVIYIDGSHHYADVARDSEVAVRKVKRGGVIIFNDYILWSHRENMWYGVVSVVNHLVIDKGAQVLGLALHPDMYADIAIQL